MDTKEANKNNLISDLEVCKNSFDLAGIPWVIMGGIVLGYARYNDVMSWDTDVDIGVFVEINKNQWNDLYRYLVKNGFTKISKIKTDFVYGKRKVPFNMWMFHKKGNFYEAFPKSTPGLKFVEKAIWYDEPKIVDFLGSKYPMPNNMDDYLIGQYGVDWKTNIIKDHERYYLDKRGSRKVASWPAGRGTKNGDMWPKILKINDNMDN
jgi:hypothetical protein